MSLVDLLEVDKTADTNPCHEPIFAVEVRYKLDYQWKANHKTTVAIHSNRDQRKILLKRWILKDTKIMLLYIGIRNVELLMHAAKFEHEAAFSWTWTWSRFQLNLFIQIILVNLIFSSTQLHRKTYEDLGGKSKLTGCKFTDFRKKSFYSLRET